MQSPDFVLILIVNKIFLRKMYLFEDLILGSSTFLFPISWTNNEIFGLKNRSL